MNGDSISEDIDSIFPHNQEEMKAPAAGTPAQQSHVIASLSRLHEYERDRRKEERFLFVSIITVLADGYLFAQMNGWAGQVVIGIIQLFGLAVYARHCGVEEVGEITDKMLAARPFSWITRRRDDL